MKCIGSTLDSTTTTLERRHTGNRNISEALWCIFKSFIMTGNMFFQWGKVHIIVRRGIHDHMKTWIASRCLAWPLNHRSTLHKRTSFLELSRSVIIPFKNSVDHFNLGLFYFGKSLLSENKIANFSSLTVIRYPCTMFVIREKMTFRYFLRCPRNTPSLSPNFVNRDDRCPRP